MKTRTLIIISVVGALVILALTSRVKPFNDSPENHVETLKQIPEVAMFYQKYDQYDVIVFPDGAYTYQTGFQATNEKGQWIMLKINYMFGFPSNTFAHCTPKGIQSQYTVRENVLDYLKNTNCFAKDVNIDKWAAEYKEISSEQQCANSYHLMQGKITHIQQSNSLTVSDYVQELDNLLEIKKDIQIQDCESFAYTWIHLVTNSEKISDPPQIVIERAYDSVRKVTNDQLVRPQYVVPWKILEFLQQHEIDFINAPPSDIAQTDEGWTDPTRLCSRLLFTNGTQFYASATFHPDPLKITGVFVDLERPVDCQKHFPIPKGF